MSLKYVVFYLMLWTTTFAVSATEPTPIPITEPAKTSPSSPAGVAPPDQSPKKTDDPYEIQLREKMPALEKLVKESVTALNETANSTNSPDKRNFRGFVLSTEVRTFKDVPSEVDKKIAAIRESIKGLIRQVATDIEISGKSGTASVSSGGIQYELPDDARKEYEALMSATHKNNVSVLSVKLAVEVLSKLNTTLMTEAEKTTDVQQKRKLYITQAAYIYELSDIALEVLNNAGLDGKAEIERISKEHKENIQQRLGGIDKLLSKLRDAKNQGVITPPAAEKQERTYNALREANKLTSQRWDEVMQDIARHETWLNNVKSKRVAAELVRDAAKTQLDTLRDVAVVGEIGSIIGNMDELLSTIGELTLLELTPETIQTLLGRNPRYEGEDMKKNK